MIINKQHNYYYSPVFFFVWQWKRKLEDINQ